MKKALLLVSILLISVASTACINNFAVQELNNKAKAFIEQGDYDAAIERLKSSLDLDDTIVETHYNLAVAYTQAEDYINAITEYNKVISLNPDLVDAYYSLGVAQSNLAVDLTSGAVLVNEDGELYVPTADKGDDKVSYKPDKKVNELIAQYKSDAINSYKTYLEKSPEASDAAEVKAKIDELSKNDSVKE